MALGSLARGRRRGRRRTYVLNGEVGDSDGADLGLGQLGHGCGEARKGLAMRLCAAGLSR